MKRLKTVEDFIEFFRSIPKNKWTTTGQFCAHGRCCAFGHLGARYGTRDTPNSARIASLTEMHPSGRRLISVNDSRAGTFMQRSAKARVLAYLQQLM